MRRSFLFALALAGAGVCLSVPAAAQDLLPEAATLTPGGYSWASDSAAAGPIAIVVSIPRQLAYVYRGEELVGVSTVSTGKEGHETPVGTFTILQKQEMHRSNLYDDAPMPWMQRLTWDGVALHAGRIPGYAASHGCVRLPTAFAKQLFTLTKVGATVTITDEDSASMQTTPAAPDTVAQQAAEPDTVAAASVDKPSLQLASAVH
jgi:lipoprotein-anchoring transpeptidase ErfK/SrfK